MDKIERLELTNEELLSAYYKEENKLDFITGLHGVAKAQLKKDTLHYEKAIQAERAKVVGEIFAEIKTIADRESPEEVDYCIYLISEMMLKNIEAKFKEGEE